MILVKREEAGVKTPAFGGENLYNIRRTPFTV